MRADQTRRPLVAFFVPLGAPLGVALVAGLAVAPAPLRAQAAGAGSAQGPAAAAAPPPASPPTAVSPAAGMGGTTGLRGLRPTAAPRTLSLQDAFALAVQQSFDLRIASARIDEARANVRKAWAMLLPNVALGGQYSFNFPEQRFSLGDPAQLEQQALLFNSIADLTAQAGAQSPDPNAQRAALERAEQLRKAARDIESAEIIEAVIQPAHVVDGQLQVQVPLFNGRAFPLLQNAYAGVDVSRIATRQARAAVIYGVARAYYQTIAAQRVARIAREQVQSAARHRDLAAQRVDAGVIIPLALQRAELDLARADQQARAADGAVKMAKAALGSLLGVVEDFELVEPPPVPPIEASGGFEELFQRALAARDDIRLQKESLGIADRGRTEAWMRLLPTVALTAAGRGTTNTQGLVNQPFTGTIGVAASIPIFDGGLTWGSIEESNARLRQELLRVQQLEALVEQEIRGTLDDLALKSEAKVTAERVAELARATRENTDRLFEAGVATSLDVTDASLAAFAADVDAARARFDLETARLGLAHALGELRPSDDLSPARLSSEEEARARRFIE
jgi:outer membrane protein